MERFYNAFNRFDAYLLLHRLQVETRVDARLQAVGLHLEVQFS
jgi:hypothetical protein